MGTTNLEACPTKESIFLITVLGSFQSPYEGNVQIQVLQHSQKPKAEASH